MDEHKKTSSPGVLKNANFRLLWIGQATSLLGDQFYLIAMPWLVLKLTNDPMALGAALALAGIPRALFMLVGGAVTDRYSPRFIMLASDILRLILVSFLTVIVLAGWTQLWLLYLLSFLFGTISGFFQPAAGAIMPAVVKGEELPAANSIYQGTAQLVTFVGPVLAGGLIALFAHSQSSSGAVELTGVAAALGVDAITFAVSIVTLSAMRLEATPAISKKPAAGLIGSIGEGFRYVWQDPLLRVFFIVLLGANFLFMGPVLVGIPVLADTRYPEGAAAYGLLLGAFGAGNFLGILLAGRLSRSLEGRMGQFLVFVLAVFGIAIALLGLVASTPVAFAILLVMGVGNGILGITAITFLQRQSPKELLGRILSLIMFGGIGLAPISQALSGWLIKLSVVGLFAGAGLLMMLLALWLSFQPAMHLFSQALAAKT
jgi:MFS family permease